MYKRLLILVHLKVKSMPKISFIKLVYKYKRLSKFKKHILFSSYLTYK